MTQSSAEWKKKLREVDHEILEILRGWKLEAGSYYRNGFLAMSITSNIFNLLVKSA